MKRVSTTLALVLGALVSFSSAAQIQGFVSGYAPGKVDQKKKAKGAESHTDLHSDFSWGLGGEFLAFPAGPLMVGGGLGFVSVQTDGGDNVVMPAVPLFASVGVIGPEAWTVRPYLEARVGYPIPATNYVTWWDKPLNFFAMGNVGVQLPYHMGVEFNCSYLTMDKYFSKKDVNFRLTSLKFGGSITVHFDLFKSDDASNQNPVVKQDPFAEPAAEDFSNGFTSTDAGENAAATENADSYSAYDNQPAEQPTDAPATEVNMIENNYYAAPVDQPADAPAEEAPVAEETPAEESAEAAPADETLAEEVAAEEAPAEEEAVEEPAPEEKPAVKKKNSKKKASKKSKAKKSSKKSKTKAKSKKKK